MRTVASEEKDSRVEKESTQRESTGECSTTKLPQETTAIPREEIFEIINKLNILEGVFQSSIVCQHSAYMNDMDQRCV